MTHASNVLGTINPIESIITKAHQHNVPVLIDAAQSTAHLPIDVKKMDIDGGDPNKLRKKLKLPDSAPEIFDWK